MGIYYVRKKRKNILITEEEIAILKRFGIIINELMTTDEVLFLIDRFLNEELDLIDEEYLELDYVANNLSERKYYMETNK